MINCYICFDITRYVQVEKLKTETENKNFIAGKHWIIVLIILLSGYGIYNGLFDLKESQNWKSESKQILIAKCISDSKDMAKKYPELTKEYCECSTNLIQAKFTQSKYIEITRKTIDEQMKILMPVFENCLTEYQSKIKKLN